jgi:hypothetical protein
VFFADFAASLTRPFTAAASTNLIESRNPRRAQLVSKVVAAAFTRLSEQRLNFKTD